MKKIARTLLALALALSLSLAMAVPAAANSVASSTMIFQGNLTYDSGTGSYSGVLPMVDEFATSLGDSVAGYDIYAREGDTAWFGDDPGTGPAWTSQAIASHDAWPAWPTDTPDWYAYSLELTKVGSTYKWAVRNHPGATAAHPWSDTGHWGGSGKPPCGVPMSGTMDWTAMYAAETDIGAYLPGTGTAEIAGGAAGKGGGAACWDMDWSWGSEVVPLEFAGFDVAVADLGSGNYRVTMTQGFSGSTALTVNVPDIVAISVSPTSIDFGSLVPGQTSSEKRIDVHNVGTREVDVDADLSGSSSILFLNNLVMRHDDAGSWTTHDWGNIITNLAMGGSDYVKTKLPVPGGYTPGGPKTGTLVFTATGV